MSELHVALEEGFSGDDVTVRVDGTPVFEGRAIETRLQIGLAHAFAAEVPDGQRELVVEVPSRSIVHRQELTVSGATYVGVSLRERSAEVRTSSEPFGYV